MLNEVNHSDRARYKVMNPAKPGKVLERIASGPDKIFILVRCCAVLWWRGSGSWHPDVERGGVGSCQEATAAGRLAVAAVAPQLHRRRRD